MFYCKLRVEEGKKENILIYTKYEISTLCHLQELNYFKLKKDIE